MVNNVLALLHGIGRFAGLEDLDIADSSGGVAVAFVSRLFLIGSL